MKKIKVVISAMCAALSLTACGNRQIFDTTYTFDKAIISMPNGTVIEGNVQSWIDYEDDDQIQVKIDGVNYLVHASDIVLIAE